MAVLYLRYQIEFQVWSIGFGIKRGHVKYATVKMIPGQAFIHAHRFYPVNHFSSYLIIAELCLTINGPAFMN
jgi:hypothetical protein